MSEIEEELRARITKLEEGIKDLRKYGGFSPQTCELYKNITYHGVIEEGCFLCDIDKLLKS